MALNVCCSNQSPTFRAYKKMVVFSRCHSSPCPRITQQIRFVAHPLHPLRNSLCTLGTDARSSGDLWRFVGGRTSRPETSSHCASRFSLSKAPRTCNPSHVRFTTAALRFHRQRSASASTYDNHSSLTRMEITGMTAPILTQLVKDIAAFAFRPIGSGKPVSESLLCHRCYSGNQPLCHTIHTNHFHSLQCDINTEYHNVLLCQPFLRKISWGGYVTRNHRGSCRGA